MPEETYDLSICNYVESFLCHPPAQSLFGEISKALFILLVVLNRAAV